MIDKEETWKYRWEKQRERIRKIEENHKKDIKDKLGIIMELQTEIERIKGLEEINSLLRHQIVELEEFKDNFQANLDIASKNIERLETQN